VVELVRRRSGRTGAVSRARGSIEVMQSEMRCLIGGEDARSFVVHACGELEALAEEKCADIDVALAPRTPAEAPQGQIQRRERPPPWRV